MDAPLPSSEFGQPNPPPRGTSGPRLLTVSGLNSLIKRVLGDNLPGTIHLVGEISNLSRHSSGHLYLTLKDDQGEIKAVMWKSSAAQLKFKPADGLEVVATGYVDVYGPRGQYQFYISKLEPRGVGALELAFRQLREKLEREGLFDAHRKKPPPDAPFRIALVTSPSGAAIRDLLHTIRRRFPVADVLLYPVRVQGEGAAAEISTAIELLNRHSESLGGIDVLITGRGGGSLEDLWAFNDEALARAIALSPVPVVTGIGHETDFTIADFVADLRAPTPTAAAELVAPPRDQLVAVLDAHEARLNFLTRRFLEGADQTLDGVQARLGRPSARLVDQHRGLDTLASRLSRQTDAALERSRTAAREGEQRWNMAWNRQADARRERLARAEDRLALLSPRRVLERGYALLTDPAGDVVSSVEVVRAGQDATALLADGALELSVTGVRDRSIVDALLQ